MVDPTILPQKNLQNGAFLPIDVLGAYLNEGSFSSFQRHFKSAMRLRLVIPKGKIMRQLTLVCQGPLPENEADRSLLFSSMLMAREEYGIHTILSTWAGADISKWAQQTFDKIILNEDPGPDWFNISRQSMSALAGLEGVEGRAIKTRTDVVISRKFLKEITTPTVNTKQIIATNLFTRLIPYHLSDMVLVADASILRSYFTIDERTAGLVCEQRFSLSLAMNHFPDLFATYGSHGMAAGWRQFMEEHVTVWDFHAAELTWLKCHDIETHPDWRFSPGISVGTPWRGELTMGAVPFSTNLSSANRAVARASRLRTTETLKAPLRPAWRKIRRHLP